MLLEHSRKNNAQANTLAAEAQQRVDALFSDAGAEVTLGQATGHNGKLDRPDGVAPRVAASAS